MNLIQNISDFGTGMTFGITGIGIFTTATITPLGL
jgi:hypothetical protein